MTLTKKKKTPADLGKRIKRLRSFFQEMVYDLIGALGGPFCKHGPRQLFANREEAKGWDDGWVGLVQKQRVGFYGFLFGNCHGRI